MLTDSQRALMAECERLYLGKARYNRDGRGPDVFDCIHFVKWNGEQAAGLVVKRSTLRTLGVDGPYASLPDQKENLLVKVFNAFLDRIDLAERQPGSVLIFKNPAVGLAHVGIAGRHGVIYHCDASLGIRRVSKVIDTKFRTTFAWNFPRVTAELTALEEGI